MSLCLFICCNLAGFLPQIHFGAEPYLGQRRGRGRESQIENDDADDDDDNDDNENSDCYYTADDSHEGGFACPKSIACQALLFLPFPSPKSDSDSSQRGGFAHEDHLSLAFYSSSVIWS
ncbi:unnamed protein product [Taenia asiatica]|uniref:Secreted protein n=1 Tax=Taenia asiatica TaxID=60517 RepID=A0A0R3VTU2_TAEAS|nr:unnamed protein product [Taenia asiatica]